MTAIDRGPWISVGQRPRCRHANVRGGCVGAAWLIGAASLCAAGPGEYPGSGSWDSGCTPRSRPRQPACGRPRLSVRGLVDSGDSSNRPREAGMGNRIRRSAEGSAGRCRRLAGGVLFGRAPVVLARCGGQLPRRPVAQLSPARANPNGAARAGSAAVPRVQSGAEPGSERAVRLGTFALYRERLRYDISMCVDGTGAGGLSAPPARAGSERVETLGERGSRPCRANG